MDTGKFASMAWVGIGEKHDFGGGGIVLFYIFAERSMVFQKYYICTAFTINFQFSSKNRTQFSSVHNFKERLCTNNWFKKGMLKYYLKMFGICLRVFLPFLNICWIAPVQKLTLKGCKYYIVIKCKSFD